MTEKRAHRAPSAPPREHPLATRWTVVVKMPVDVDHKVGCNRLRLARGEGTLLVGHDLDAVWTWH